ncbi:putative protein S-acyltransferase 6 [Porphyridium purpureum]|uniref:Palmitoyltransferase n=1 Tax=Porphyridium purpureum TaxID=35688 RepID=A0A5J4Z7L7_PORPP|nr:putative protein S-acyltransferase 6 [Porphyridium purpureum]|eukprot:POR4568..scf295_1
MVGARYDKEWYRGNHLFPCGGRVIVGPKWPGLFLTLGLLLLGLGVGVATCAWMMLEQGPPSAPRPYRELGIGLVVPFVLMWMLALAFLVRVSLTDPGVVRSSETEPPGMRADGEQQGNRMRRLPVTIDGVLYKHRFCETCRIWRPLRCSHCAVCNACIDRFDHHCPWLAGCVGRRNYRHYVFFCFFTCMSCIIQMAIGIVQLTRPKCDESGDECLWLSWGVVTAILCVVEGGFFSMMTLSLVSYHTFLMWQNMTTKEHKQQGREHPEPERGWPSVKSILFGRLPPSAFEPLQSQKQNNL